MVRSYNGNKALSVLAQLLLFVREIEMRFYVERNAIIESVFSHLSLSTHSFFRLILLVSDNYILHNHTMVKMFL